jgi:hypothetical protein
MDLYYYDFNMIKTENALEGSLDWQQKPHDHSPYIQSQQLELVNPLLWRNTIGDFFYDLQVLAVQSTGNKSMSIIVYETLTDKFQKLFEIAVTNLFLH